MAKSNDFENDLMQLIFNNVAIADLGDASGVQPSGSAGNLYVALHTADPGEAGNQSTSECTYTGYARIAVVRSAGGWTVSGNSATNTAEVLFGECTAGSETATDFSVGLESSGSTRICYKGTLDSSRAISSGVTPRFAAGTLTVTEE